MFVFKKIAARLPKNILRQHADDIKQEGLIALWKAAVRFDESKGFSFSTYAVSLIYRYMYRYVQDLYGLRRVGEKPEIISLDEPTCENMTVGDLIPSPENIDISWVLENKKLTERQREILRLMYYGGYKQFEVAKKLNITKQAVTAALKRIAEKLRDDYKE